MVAGGEERKKKVEVAWKDPGRGSQTKKVGEEWGGRHMRGGGGALPHRSHSLRELGAPNNLICCGFNVVVTCLEFPKLGEKGGPINLNNK